MFGVYLWFALFLAWYSGNMEDPSMFLCDTLIEGSVCESEGMAIYISQGDTPTRPSTFYPIDHTQWAFTTSSNSEYLGISSSDYPNVSGKFSGVFTAPYSATFYFELALEHTVTSKACYLNLSENPLFVEADLNYSGTGSDGGYGYWYKKNYRCSSSDSYTNQYYLHREYTLVKGQKYPLFAGMRYNVTLPAETGPWLKLTWYLSYNYQNLITTKTAVVGLSGYTDTSTATASSGSSGSSSGGSSGGSSDDSSGSDLDVGDSSSGGDGSSSASASFKKTNGAVVGGSCAGAVVAVAVGVVAFRTFSKGKSWNGKSSSGARSSRSRGSNGSVPSGPRSGGGLTGGESMSRGDSGRTSRESGWDRSSGRTSRESGWDRSSGRTSRESGWNRSSGRTSRESGWNRSSGRTSRESGGSRSSGRSSRDGFGPTDRGGVGVTNRLVNQQRGPLVGGPVPRLVNQQRGPLVGGPVPRVGNQQRGPLVRGPVF